MVEKHLPWTPKIPAALLTALAETANVQYAAQQMPRSPTTCYAWRTRDPTCAEAWDATMEPAVESVFEAEAMCCGLEGVDRDVFFQGKKVGSTREYADTLLMFLLKGWKPARYKARSEVVHAGAIALLRTLEQMGKMSPDELPAFLLEAAQEVNGLEQEGRP